MSKEKVNFNKKNTAAIYFSYDDVTERDCSELNEWLRELDGRPEVSIKCDDDGFEIIFTEVGA